MIDQDPVSRGAPRQPASDRLLVGLTTSLLVGGLAISGLLLLLRVRANGAFAVPAVMVIVGAIGLKVRRPWTAAVLLSVWAGVVGLYLVESGVALDRWMSLRAERRARAGYAASCGRSYDFRTQGEFLLALRAEGIHAYPAFPRGTLFRSSEDGRQETVLRGDRGEDLLPLGSIAGVETVFGNESGEYLVYRSDEHGFNNPQGVWQGSSISVAIVGDSCAHGASVPPSRNLTAPLRSRWPDTLNLGHGGNGPLSELATILEFLPARRPKVVLWLFSESNDLYELEREKNLPVLRHYLETPGSLQQLESRQAEIDRRLKEYVDARLTPATVRPAPASTFAGCLALRNLRWRIYRFRHRKTPDFRLFAEILAAARKTVSAWEGALVFVYLPVQPRIDPRNPRTPRPEMQGQVLAICDRLAIPAIDLNTGFLTDSSQFSRYVYPFPAHLTEAGYLRVGEMVADELEQRGLLAQ